MKPDQRPPAPSHVTGRLFALWVSCLSVATPAAPSLNGFDLSDTLVPAREILRGGPPRDGIPALDAPRFLSAAEAAREVKDDDRVLGLALGGEAHAYPIAIMNWHEIVNDTIAGLPVVVTYCPLCGSGIAFERRIDGRTRRFGVSGLLYNSDVLLYDRESESLWSQLLGRAVSGPMKGRRLVPIALEHTRWGRWRTGHPGTRVLSRRTGYDRDYDRDPYAGYRRSRRLVFPVAGTDRRYHPKETVVGLVIDGRARAWPFSELARVASPLRDRLAGRPLRVEFDVADGSARIVDGEGRRLAAVTAFWFAWIAFHPDTEVFHATREP